MAFMSILISSGILMVIWFSLSGLSGLIGLALFLWGLIPYHRTPTDKRKKSHYIKMSFGIIFLVAALFGLCILFPVEIFIACLASLAGVVLLCFAVPKQFMSQGNVKRRPLTTIVIGVILIAASVAYMAIYGMGLIISIAKTFFAA